MDQTETWIEQCLSEAEAKDTSHLDEKENCDLEDLDQPKPSARKASKPHSTPLTLQWLEDTYEIAEGVCIPRSTLYMHYLDFCEKNDTQPVNAASFGKIIRQQFPQLTTRRLGTRGQSKYHYYGIAVKESSAYFDVMYSKQGVQGTPGDPAKKDPARQTVAYSPRSKLGTLLPEFPCVKDLKLPASVPEEKVSTFIMMYRTHCQRILDTVIRANFDEVQSYLLHFWQGMPPHMLPILGSTPVVNIVGVCDSILYKAISGVLMPSVLQALPDSLTQVIRKFAKQLDEWLRVALDDLPDPLQNIKFDLARRFSQMLKRQTSLNHLCQASRTVIHSNDITSQMLEDWKTIDLSSISRQTLYTVDNVKEDDHQMIVKLYTEFSHILEDQSPIEAYTEWLDSMVDRCVVKPASKKPATLKRVARQFLLMWSCFGTRVIRDMTLHSSPSFGSFHLMHLMFDEYVLYLVESLHMQERTNELMRQMKGEQLADSSEEIILPNPSFPPVPLTLPTATGDSSVRNTSTIPTSPTDSNASYQSPHSYNPMATSSSSSMATHSPHDNMSHSRSASSSHMAMNNSHMVSLYTPSEDHNTGSGMFHYPSGYNHGVSGQYPPTAHDGSSFRFGHYPPSMSQYSFNGRVNGVDQGMVGNGNLHNSMNHNTMNGWSDSTSRYPTSNTAANPSLHYGDNTANPYSGSFMNFSHRNMDYENQHYNRYASSGCDGMQAGSTMNTYPSGYDAYSAGGNGYYSNKGKETGNSGKRKSTMGEMLADTDVSNLHKRSKGPNEVSAYSQHYQRMQTAS
ncbi:regulatory factor X 4-like isoform X2 [Ptychodera flava]|uniref:regulatory factor X 4-like isoform X2 n=1 Tax=Ptychodera flava TaxID=63121 RepID=UPI00396A1278